MVQIIDDPYGGSIFGRLGAGFGKGLGEELPKAVKRGQTANALERLRGKDLDALQQSAELIRSGSDISEVGQFLPLIQQSQKTQALAERAKNGPSIPNDQNQSKGIQQLSEKPLSSKERILKAKESLLREPSQHELDVEADQLIKNKSAFSEEEALEKAKARRAETKKSQLQNISDFKTSLNESAKRVLQGEGLNDYKDVEGRLTQNQIDLGEADIAEGKNPAVVEKNRRDILEKIGRASTQIKKIADKSLFTTRSSQKISEWKSQKKIFDDNGYGNEFIDLIAGHQGITQMETANAIVPLKNEKILKDISIDKNLGALAKIVGSPNGIKKLNKDAIDSVINNITPEDNILSVGYKFREKGLDVDELFQTLKASNNEKPFLTDEQIYQLDLPVNNNFYGDLLFEARK